MFVRNEVKIDKIQVEFKPLQGLVIVFATVFFLL